MTIVNGLCTVAEVREALYAGTSQSTDDDGKIERAIEAASRKLETHCGRVFSYDTAVSARVYVATNPYTLDVDDFGTATGLVVKTDTVMDASWATTLVTATLQLEPLNGRRDGVTWAYTRIGLVGSARGYFPVSSGHALVQVTARWGWPSVPAPIREACIVQSVAVFKAADSPFGVAGVGDMGVIRVKSGLHPTAQELCRDYRKQVLVA